MYIPEDANLVILGKLEKIHENYCLVSQSIGCLVRQLVACLVRAATCSVAVVRIAD